MAKDFPTREENYAQWYNDLVIKADLAENSAVRGCMVINHMDMPYGRGFRQFLIKSSKTQGIRMPISQFLFQNPFSAKRRAMWRDLPKSARWSPITG